MQNPIEHNYVCVFKFSNKTWWVGTTQDPYELLDRLKNGRFGEWVNEQIAHGHDCGKPFNYRFQTCRDVGPDKDSATHNANNLMHLLMLRHGLENVRGMACTDAVANAGEYKYDIGSVKKVCFKCLTRGHFSNACQQNSVNMPTRSQQQFRNKNKSGVKTFNKVVPPTISKSVHVMKTVTRDDDFAREYSRMMRTK